MGPGERFVSLLRGNEIVDNDSFDLLRSPVQFFQMSFFRIEERRNALSRQPGNPEILKRSYDYTTDK